jgi:hypothetical protein
MGFRILGTTEQIMQGYTARSGLEGPFAFACGRVLYYDTSEGAYWDPRTDFYIDRNEADMLHNETVRILSK